MKRFFNLFVVLAIAVSTTVLAFAFQKDADKIKRDQATTLSNLKQLSLGMLMYCNDNDDLTPHYKQSKQWKESIYPYIKSKEIFKTLNPAGGEFKVNPSTCGKPLMSISKVAETPMFYESFAWPDGKRSVSFWDGHVSLLDKAGWTKAKKRLLLKKKDFK